MSEKNNTRQQAIRHSESWWLCENIINHAGQVALLRMDFPQVFILIRDYGESYFANFDEFKDSIAEVNFFRPQDRKKANLDEILVDAWNFLALTEEEEERQYNLNNGYQDNDIP